MSETAVPSYYLHTKLYRPSLSEDYVPRPRLLAQLDKIAHYQLAILTAPAGYGKSTLASAWVEQVHYPHAWLSLDEGDDDLIIFIGYFVSAIQTIFPEFGREIMKFAQAPARPSLATATSYLLRDLDQLTSDFVLILDDFHVIKNLDIHEVLSGLLRYPLPHFHLVLVSRHDLPTHIAKLRAQGRLLEIRAMDLRFSAAEVEDFLRKTLLTAPDSEMVQNLTDKTEGWPVGLRLATIAIRRWGIADHQPALLQVENTYVIDYLVSEVLVRQSMDVRSFLLKSAILDRFCLPLCAAIMDQESLDAGILDKLEREGLFIESLDNQREWFRYHQLFRDMLRHRLEAQTSAAEVAAMHLRASRWLADHGYVEDAINHALTSGDVQFAANILAQRSIKLINNERWLLLESLLNKFPPEAIHDEPNLLLILAWLMLAKMRLDQLAILRTKLEAHIKTSSPMREEERFLACSVHTFAAVGFNWVSDYEKAIFHGRKVLTESKLEWGLLHAYVWIHLGTASQQLEGGQAGLTVLAEEDSVIQPVLNQVRKHIAVAFVDWLSGDINKLAHSAENGLKLLGDVPFFTSKSMLHMLAGSAYYQQTDMAAAEQHFRIVLGMKYGFQFQAYILSAIGQALIYQAQNMVEEAWQMSETAVDFCLEIEHPTMLFFARAFQAELALRQGRLDQARLWAAQVDPTTLPKLMPYLYQPQMTLPKIWLAEGTPDSLRKAETELQRLHDIATAAHNVPCQIQVFSMQSLLFQAQQKMAAAEETQVQALRLAQPGGIMRLFVDLGPQMANLLKHLYMQGHAPVYLRQILDAFPTAKPTQNSVLPMALVESLTEREMEVLGLLAQRLSNKEIAKMLVISTETVKRHTSNIYQKLQVKNRRQAVAKAYKLNLLVDMPDPSI